MSDELTRWGIKWNGPTNPLATAMHDGYWTPWHEAAARIAALELELVARDKRVYVLEQAKVWPDETGLRLAAEKAKDRGNHDLYHAILALIPKEASDAKS